MIFLKKDSKKKTYLAESVEAESSGVNDGDDSSPFDGADAADYDDDSDYEIDFYQELSNGTLVFKIIDDDQEHAGHVVVSSKGTVSIIESSSFYVFDDADIQYLKTQAQKFYDALKL